MKISMKVLAGVLVLSVLRVRPQGRCPSRSLKTYKEGLLAPSSWTM